MVDPTLFASIRKGQIFQEQDGKSLLVAAANAGALPVPKLIRLGRVPGPDRAAANPRIWQLWGIQKAFGHPMDDTFRPDDIRRFTVAPSQIAVASTVFEIDGQEIATLGGHYALRDGEDSIEFGFDRSFIRGLGIHRLSLAYRLYASATALVLSGRDRDFTPIFGRILCSNDESRRNYARAGAHEFTHLPQCLSAVEAHWPLPRLVGDGGGGGRRVVGYWVFPPFALLAGFDAMLDAADAGRWATSRGNIPLDLDLGDLERTSVTRELRPKLVAICRRQMRKLHRSPCYKEAAWRVGS